MTDVAIVGVGIHPFGRHKDVTGLEMGAVAARAALADAGLKWTDIDYAIGGSFEVDIPDAIVAYLGLTGIDFTNVFNGCATAGTALSLGVQAIRSGRHDRVLVVGLDKHPAGAFTADPAGYGCPAWYGEMGFFLTPKFFGMKINRYMHDYGITTDTLGRVAAKNYANGSLNPNAFRRTPLTVEQIVGSRMVSYPLTQYMFCSPDEGAAAVVLCRGEDATNYSPQPVRIRSVEVGTRRYGAFEVHSPSVPVDRVLAPTTDVARAAFEAAGVEPGDIDIAQLQDTDAGAEIIHMAEVPSRPISEGLFTWPVPAPPSRPALRGARCAPCGAVAFPSAPGCPRCGEDRMEPVELPARGTLYTWTTQEFLPKLPYLGPETPQTFEPWAVGYVELDGRLRVEGRLYDVDPKELRFGMEFDVVVRLFRITEDGTEVYTYGFAPAAGTAVS